MHIVAKYFFTALLISFLPIKKAKATHIMGGEITWTCQGNGSYIFELIVYRDCNGFDISVGAENIRVWNHPTITNINVNFVERNDLSPVCTEVAGGPTAFACGAGSSGGNGSGAIERAVYRSNPIVLTGNPGSEGWVFTYDSFSRNGNLTNIQNPLTVGITVVAKMFNTGANGTCNDSSPRFLETPFVVSCAGTPFVYNPNAYDPDLDSMAFVWGVPLNQINTTYNPPADPNAIAFEPGFTFDSPTPNAGMNPGNVPAALNAINGELSFTSFNSGNFAVKVLVRTYRAGVLTAEIQREMQVVVENCAVPNNAPAVTAPFPGNAYAIDVFAGDVVDFSLFAEDFDLLQDGQPQTVSIQASGAQFGTNFTNSAAGCPEPPCAVLNTTPPVSGSPSATLDFSWQTDCNHLVGAGGIALNSVPYNFVFRVKDDLCQIPAVKYVTVTVNVLNKAQLPETEIHCLQVQPNGDVIIQWDEINDLDNGFESYEVHSVEDGLLATIPLITTTSYLHVGANADVAAKNYFIVTKSGCNGLSAAHSDTLQTIFMTLNNPGNGTAIIQWSGPGIIQSTSWNDYVHIEREYPAGTWSIVDSVAFGLTSNIDTIDICSAFLNYRVSLPTSTCSFISNIDGDDFEDQIGPNIPEIQSVSIDTITGQVVITWDENSAPDTYGYIIYTQDAGGFYTDLDTLWGITSTTYFTSPSTSDGPLSYSVAAFDSCYTPQVPPTFQTSAKADVHVTNYLQGQLDICAQRVNLSWSNYIGWPEGISEYVVFGFKTNGLWENLGTTPSNTISIDVETGTTYCLVVEAISNDGRRAFSNRICIDIVSPDAPETHYLSTATVEDERILIKHLTSIPAGDGGLVLQRLNEKTEEFEEIETRTVSQLEEVFEDLAVDPSRQSYTYRIMAIDSCGRPSIESNIGKTIFLETFVDDNNMTIYLQWSRYEDWKAPVVSYSIHRGVDDVIDPFPLAVVGPDIRSYQDNVEDFLYSSGRICYYVVATEGTNVLGRNEFSRSNTSCGVLEPLIYIPNAFTVGGKNPVFVPIVNLFDYSNYEFTVFDRWGQALFRTNDASQGWIGDTPSGAIAKEGTYVYVIRLKDGNGNEITRRGHVTLLDYRRVEE